MNLYGAQDVLWDKVLKNEPSQICGRQPLINLSGMGCLSRPYNSKFFKGCLPRILLGPFLNILSHINILLIHTNT